MQVVLRASTLPLVAAVYKRLPIDLILDYSRGLIKIYYSHVNST
jgi:hypothetical protein